MTKLSFNKKTNVKPKLVHDQELWAEDVNEMMDLLEELYTSVLNFQNAQSIQTFAEAWPVGGMKVRGYATNYPILDQFYNAVPKTVTHAAAPTTAGWGRIDAVVTDVQGEVLIIQGDAGAVFTEPTVDATTHYLIRYFLILANATSPVDPITGNKPAVSLVAYRENLGDAGGEANASGSNVSINVNSANSLIGAIGIEATNVQKMHKALFAWPVMQSTVGITHLQYVLELKAIVDPSKYWFIGLLKNGKRISNSWFLFKNAQYGFNASSLTEQTILIPIEATPFQNTDFNGLEIFFYHGSNTIPGYFMDNIEFLNGISTNPNVPETTDWKLYASGDARIGLYKNLVLNSEIDLRTAVQPNHLAFASQAAMIAGQSLQRKDYQYFDGTSTWQYLGTTLGTISDYRIIGSDGGVASDYTIDIVANVLKLYKDAVEVGSKDLSIYLDDTNLARLTSGVLNSTTGIATFTRDDASTFTLDLSNLLDNQTAAEVSVDSAAFTGNLAVTDNTVQKVAEKLNALVLGGGGSTLGIVTVATTTYTFLLTDAAKKVIFTSATAVTATIPTNAVTAIPIGSRIEVTQSGNGVVTLVSTGLTVISASPLFLVKGQTVILIKTAINTWSIEGNNFSGELRFPTYPSTRDDGVNPTNKSLGVDINGNVKHYKQGLFPAPYIDVVVPDSTLPSTTGNFELYGSFFTPTMTAVFTGQTVNYITFHTTNWVTVNVTTGATEGLFGITLDNGLNKTFANAYMVVLGTIFKPVLADWTVVSGNLDLSNEGEAIVQSWGAASAVSWNKQFDFTKSWSFRYSDKISPLGSMTESTYYRNLFIKTISGTTLYTGGVIRWTAGGVVYYHSTILPPNSDVNTTPSSSVATVKDAVIELRYNHLTGVLTTYANSNLLQSRTITLTENCKLHLTIFNYDVINIKYIELAT